MEAISASRAAMKGIAPALAAIVLGLGACGGGGGGGGTVQPPPPSPPPPAGGLDSRPVNTTCVAPALAVGATAITLDAPFPGLPAFSQPTLLLRAPAPDGRWFVLEKAGRIRVFEDDPAASTAPTWLDLSAQVNPASEGGLLGLAFDPRWPDRPELYLSYTGDVSGQMTSFVSRFILDDTVQPASRTEQRLLAVTQPFGNHNGGGIAFGPDGLLYLGLGDGGGAGDPQATAQDTTRLLGAFLRMDVLDVPWPDPGYRIPADNPFAGNPPCGAGLNAQPCPEIHAWGFRNPWRWSFDAATGQLWAGDVGQNAWEEVDVVEQGGNYGWDCREGAHDFEPAKCAGLALVEPVAEYGHALGNSITGGFVYRGPRVPALAGRYVFGDFGSGRIWALRPDGSGGLEPEQLLESGLNIVAFAEDAQGDLLVLDFGGGIRALAPGGGGPGSPVPDELADTGCVDPADPRRPAAGLVPYGLNAPAWFDGAAIRRWIGLPEGTAVAIGGDGDWLFPPGTVLVQRLDLAGSPVETRLLMHHPGGSWAGYSYAWDDAGSGAVRVRGGLTRIVGGQTWIHPSEADCLACHIGASGRALGPETPQMNRNLTYPATGRTANQLTTLDEIGYFASPLAGDPAGLPRLPDPADPAAPLADRARAYLHANCSGCHRPGGPTPSALDLRYDTALADTNGCDAVPQSGDLGVQGARVIAPGDAGRSVLALRMDRRDFAGMPPLGTARVDDGGVALVAAWIDGLAGCR